MEAKKEWLEWLASDDTGISSKTMFSAITGIPVNNYDVPHDVGDVGRCIRMLRALPDLRSQLKLVIDKFPEWMPFIDAWKDIENLYAECEEWEKLSEAEKKKRSSRKHFVNPNSYAYRKIDMCVSISRYLNGLRFQNSFNSMRNKSPLEF